jgi:hypothetical protein
MQFWKYFTSIGLHMAQARSYKPAYRGARYRAFMCTTQPAINDALG